MRLWRFWRVWFYLAFTMLCIGSFIGLMEGPHPGERSALWWALFGMFAASGGAMCCVRAVDEFVAWWSNRKLAKQEASR